MHSDNGTHIEQFRRKCRSREASTSRAQRRQRSHSPQRRKRLRRTQHGSQGISPELVDKHVHIIARHAVSGSIFAAVDVACGCSIGDVRQALRVATNTSPEIGIRLLLEKCRSPLDAEIINSAMDITVILAERQLLVTASYDRSAGMWDAATGEWLSSLFGHGHSVMHLAISPDGRSLATASADCTVRMWDLRSGRCRITLKGHKSSVLSVAFSHDGLWLATSSGDSTARVWSTGSFGECWLRLRGHTRDVSSVCFSPDDVYVVTASEDCTAKIWDARTGAVEGTLRNDHPLNWASVSPDGRFIAIAMRNCTVCLWSFMSKHGNTHDGFTCLKTLLGHAGEVLCVSFSPNGSQLATASADGSAGIWSSQTGERLGILQHDSCKVLAVNFSPNGSLLATACSTGDAKLWNTVTMQCCRRLEGHDGAVTCACFGPTPS